MMTITLSTFAGINTCENSSMTNMGNISTEQNRSKIDQLGQWDFLVIAALSGVMTGMIYSCYTQFDSADIFNKHFNLWSLTTIGMLVLLSTLVFFGRTLFTKAELSLKTFLMILLIMFVLSILIFTLFGLTSMANGRIHVKLTT